MLFFFFPPGGNQSGADLVYKAASSFAFPGHVRAGAVCPRQPLRSLSGQLRSPSWESLDFARIYWVLGVRVLLSRGGGFFLCNEQSPKSEFFCFWYREPYDL